MSAVTPLRVPAPRWRDWTWQMRHRIRDAEALSRWVRPTADERRAIDELSGRFRFVITPYYASLMDPDDPECPIRRQVVPRTAELAKIPAGLADPLDEVAHSPVKNVIRVYPDRIAFCVNNECALYCRFCLRKRMVGDSSWAMKKRELGGRARLDPRGHAGDPRRAAHGRRPPGLLGRAARVAAATELRAIPHVEIVRLGTRLPVTLPFRVTDELVPHARASTTRSG